MKTTIEISIDESSIGEAATKQASQLVAAALSPGGRWGEKGGPAWQELQRQVEAAVLGYLASDDHAEKLRMLVETRIQLAVEEIAIKVAAAAVRKAAKP